MLDVNDKGLNEKLDFALWSVGGSSDYRNDRERPYDGQSHTTYGERGKTEVRGLTMRDIQDCFIQALLVCAKPELSEKVVEIDIEVPEKYAAKGTWCPQDVYEIDFKDIDPLAVAQNLGCFIEHYMGIFPNVPKFDFDKTMKEL